MSELKSSEFPAALRKVVGKHQQYSLVGASDAVEVRQEWHREGLRAFASQSNSSSNITFARLWVFGSKVLLKCFSYGTDLTTLVEQVEHVIAAHREAIHGALRMDNRRTVHAQVFFPLEISKSTFKEWCPKMGLKLPPAGPLLDEDRFYFSKIKIKLT